MNGIWSQVLTQMPHLMHLLLSMTCTFLTSPTMASTGQLRAQSVQPLHFSGSME